MTTQTCSRCGSKIPEGHVICPVCGASASKRRDYVRCSHCLHRAPAELTLCPHCGRELKPWRADKWVAAGSLIILLGLWLMFGNGLALLGQAGNALGQLLPPPVTPVTDVVALAPAATATQPSPTPTDTLSPTATATATFAPTATFTPIITPTEQPPTAAPLATSTISATLAAQTPTITPTQAVTPTSTSTPTATVTPTSTPSPTLTPTASPDVYVVKAGDTLSTIAAQVDRTIAALAAYNNIKDPTTIQVGQTLKIPPADYVPPTPTPKRPTKTPTPTATPTPSITLPAPHLVNPGPNAAFNGENALIELIWQPLPTGLPAGAQYVVHVGVQVGPGADDIEWRLIEPVGDATSFYVPAWLFGQAPQAFGRAYPWFVQVAVVTENGDHFIPISQPSEIRKFFWN